MAMIDTQSLYSSAKVTWPAKRGQLKLMTFAQSSKHSTVPVLTGTAPFRTILYQTAFVGVLDMEISGLSDLATCRAVHAGFFSLRAITSVGVF